MRKLHLFYFGLMAFLLVGIYGFTEYSLKNANSVSTSNFTVQAKDSSQKSLVYMTKDINPQKLVEIYTALNRKLTGKVAVKIHSGEPGGQNFLRADLMKDLVQSLHGTIVECNTAYPGKRVATAMHKQTMIDHGFTAIAPTDIMDEDSSIALPVKKGKHLKIDLVGSHFINYDSYLVLSHFKGHMMGGFGGALKNISIGIASTEGKMWIHTAGVSKSTKDFGLCFQTPQDNFLESMAEAAGAVMNYMGNRVVYINVMKNLSVDCDCDAHAKAPCMSDIGILASLDPIALDQACVDLLYKAPDGKDIIQRMESKHGIHILEHAANLGLGNRNYQIISLDK